MKKNLIAIGMMLVLLTIGFSGCTQKNNQNSNQINTENNGSNTTLSDGWVTGDISRIHIMSYNKTFYQYNSSCPVYTDVWGIAANCVGSYYMHSAMVAVNFYNRTSGSYLGQETYSTSNFDEAGNFGFTVKFENKANQPLADLVTFDVRGS